MNLTLPGLLLPSAHAWYFSAETCGLLCVQVATRMISHSPEWDISTRWTDKARILSHRKTMTYMSILVLSYCRMKNPGIVNCRPSRQMTARSYESHNSEKDVWIPNTPTSLVLGIVIHIFIAPAVTKWQSRVRYALDKPRENYVRKHPHTYDPHTYDPEECDPSS